VYVFEDVSVGGETVVDLDDGRKQLEKLVVVLQLFLHVQIAIVAEHLSLYVAADVPVLLHIVHAAPAPTHWSFCTSYTPACGTHSLVLLHIVHARRAGIHSLTPYSRRPVAR